MVKSGKPVSRPQGFKIEFVQLAIIAFQVEMIDVTIFTITL